MLQVPPPRVSVTVFSRRNCYRRDVWRGRRGVKIQHKYFINKVTAGSGESCRNPWHALSSAGWHVRAGFIPKEAAPRVCRATEPISLAQSAKSPSHQRSCLLLFC